MRLDWEFLLDLSEQKLSADVKKGIDRIGCNETAEPEKSGVKAGLICFWEPNTLIRKSKKGNAI